MEYKALSAIDTVTTLEKQEIANFLFHHLDQYGDRMEDIMKCLDYALNDYSHQGGFALLARENGDIKGVVVVNQTGMEGYIPENILVYIAVHNDTRGKGVGKELMLRAIKLAKGDIALHVEADNPARKLYEKIGFTSKYLEMRYHKK